MGIGNSQLQPIDKYNTELIPFEEVKDPKISYYENKFEQEPFSLKGMEGKEENTLHRSVGFNEFEKNPIKIPDCYKKIEVDENYIKNFIWDPTKTPIVKKKVPEYNQKHYDIHWNGSVPFVTYVDENIVTVYQKPTNNFIPIKDDDINDYKQFFTEKLFQFNAKEIFIGIDTNIPENLGNTILIYLGNNQYIFIGNEIYMFETEDSIKEYYSPILNSDIPYPTALSDTNIYFMLDKTYAHSGDFSMKERNNLYDQYYSKEDKKTLNASIMKNIHILKKYD